MTLRLPEEIIQLVALETDTLAQYTNLLTLDRATHQRLATPHAFKILILKQFEQDAVSALKYLIIHLSSERPFVSQIFDAFLDTPAILRMLVADSKEVIRLMNSRTYDAGKLRIVKALHAYNKRNGPLPEQAHIMEESLKPAINHFDLELVSYLIEEAHVNLRSLDLIDEWQWHIRLLCEGRCDILRLLLKNGATFSVNTKLASQLLAHHNDPESLRILLNWLRPAGGEEYNAAIIDAWNTSTYEGHVDIVRLLLEEFQVNPRLEEKIAVRWACRRGYDRILEMLFAAGLTVGEIQDDLPLFFAIRNNLPKVVSVLINQGIDVDTQQAAALREAARHGQLEIVKLLVQAGADISACNFEAIKTARERKYSELVNYLTLNCHLKRQTSML